MRASRYDHAGWRSEKNIGDTRFFIFKHDHHTHSFGGCSLRVWMDYLIASSFYISMELRSVFSTSPVWLAKSMRPRNLSFESSCPRHILLHQSKVSSLFLMPYLNHVQGFFLPQKCFSRTLQKETWMDVVHLNVSPVTVSFSFCRSLSGELALT